MSTTAVVYWALAAATLSASFIGFHNHPVWRRLCVVASLIFFGIGWYYQKEEQYEQHGNDAKYVGELEPDTNFSHPMPAGCHHVPPGAFHLFLGSTMVWMEGDQAVLDLPDSYVKVRVANGELALDLLLRDEDGNVVVKIQNNHFVINPHATHRMRFPDPQSLFVYDLQDREVLRIEFLNPKDMYMTATFADRLGFPFVVTDKNLSFQGVTSDSNCLGPERGAIWAITRNVN